MSTVNIGNQKVSFSFGEAGKSTTFNALNYKLFPLGVYSRLTTSGYTTGDLVIKNVTTVTIKPAVMYLYDIESHIGVRVETQDELDVNPTQASPYIIVKMDWDITQKVYADILCLATNLLQPDYVILGKADFDTLGNIIAIDYTRRDNIDLLENNSAYNKFKVFADKTSVAPLLNFTGGEIVINGHKRNIPSTNIPLSTSPSKRYDLIVLGDSATPIVVQGVDSSTPVVPDYLNRRVIAEVLVDGNRLIGSNIKNIDQSIYVTGNSDTPTFNKVTLLDPIVSETQAVTKKYVDDIARSLDPQESVISFLDFVTSEPSVRVAGDRYIATATGDSSDTTTAVTINRIYTWALNTAGTTLVWRETTPDKGTFLLNEADSKQYVYTGTVWTQLSATVAHNELAGLQGGTAGEFYHVTLNEKNNLFVKNVDTTTNIVEGTNLFYTEARVNANTHVATAYNHSLISSGNPHNTLATDLADFTTQVNLNARVSTGYAHALIVTGNPHNTTKADIGLGAVTNDAQIPLSYIDQPNGVPSLDIDRRLIEARLPVSVPRKVTDWSPLTLVPPPASTGSFYYVTASGPLTLGSITYWNVGDLAYYDGANWVQISSGVRWSARAGDTQYGHLAYTGLDIDAGKFNGSSTNPTGTLRLNFEGELHATKFVGDGTGLSGLSLEWGPLGIYSTNNIVFYNGTIYKALASSTGLQPDLNPNEWLNWDLYLKKQAVKQAIILG